VRQHVSIKAEALRKRLGLSYEHLLGLRFAVNETAAIVIAAGITFDSTTLGIVDRLHKVAEVLFGCIVGVLVSWIMSKVWLIKIPAE
jgi:acid phosphatase family membrane protein YuiD